MSIFVPKTESIGGLKKRISECLCKSDIRLWRHEHAWSSSLGNITENLVKALQQLTYSKEKLGPVVGNDGKESKVE